MVVLRVVILGMGTGIGTVWMEVVGTYMWANFEGTMSRSSPTSALPVARIRFSPFAVRGMSEVPVWRPLRDHSVSP